LKSKVLKKMQRSIIKNFLDMIILTKLRKSNPLSGYDFIEFIHKKFGMLISAGTIYAVLYSMERKGLIRGELTQAKRIYVLTDQGKETVSAVLELDEEVQRFMRSILSV
jgi:DNA-binding PadR family transcriptional regulator